MERNDKKMKKKIIFYLSSLTKGGAQRVILNLTESLLKKEYEVVIVTTLEEENEYELPGGAKRILSDLTPEEITKSRWKNLKHRYLKLRNIWKKEKPDIIVSFIGKNNIMAIVTSLGLKIPVAVSVRGEPTEEYYNKVLRFLAKYLFRFASGVILQTKESRQFFPKKTLQKAVVLPNPLNPVFLEKPYEGEKEKKIVLVGRIDSNKNQRMAVQAFAKIHEKFPEYYMEIWGEGEERESLFSYVKELGLKDKIFLPGATNQVKEKLETATLYVLPSNTEGMPNSLMEAMALGIPSISTDCPCGGPAELITDGFDGLLVPVGKVNPMAEAMERVLSDNDLREKLSINSLKIRERLDPIAVNNQWEEYLNSLTR